MRHIVELSKGWTMGSCDPTPENTCPKILPNSECAVTLPHVWNKDDPTQSGVRIYRSELPGISSDRRAFLEFEAVAGVCRVWVNEAYIGEHRGGYSRFRFEITDALHAQKNILTVSADNTRYPDICPLTGDFDNYGGIYRPVHLIETGPIHFDMLHLGDDGLELKATLEQGTVGMLEAIARVPDGTGMVEYILSDDNGVAASVTAPAGERVTLCVPAVHRWNGLQDPHLYLCRARLLVNGECVDEVALPCGFRSVAMTPDKGLLLNGQALKICGVAKHQDRQGVASATTTAQLDEDMALIREIGANSVRLSHYQHPQYFYDLCDRNGLLVWAEIPMLSMPDGNTGVFENARQQLLELIAQNRHHPSIYCWGIQNEIAIAGESLEMYRKTEDLDTLARSTDPARITACANLYYVKNNSQMNFITGMVGYNIYYGWYYGEMEDYSTFFDKFHADNPQVPLGVSEYGVDCSTGYHSPTPKRKDYSEDFQALFHETVYPQIASRDYLWGSYVWNMFDFGSSLRKEGGMSGQNRKGLVTFDRAVKKDAFFFYKAWWSTEPFVYIAGRRFANRSSGITTIKVYSNQPEVALLVNGEPLSVQHGEHVFTFSGVPIPLGETVITVTAGSLQDTITLTGVAEPDPAYIYIDPNPEINVKNWFTPGQGPEDLFPSDRFSIMDTIGDLKANQAAWALLEENIPQIANDKRMGMIPGMPLLRILNRFSGQFREEELKEINRKLGAIIKD